MSMGEYPINDSAVFLVTEDVALAINMSFNNDHRSVSELSPQEREELSDAALAGEVIEDIEGAATHSEFDWNAINLYDRFVKESDSPREIEFHEDYLVYVAADMAPSLFDAAYPDFTVLASSSPS